jgi:CMP-N,N'-diacetyllegionaminic acid synthase
MSKRTNSRPLCLALIPARGGSKGVARKNIRLLAGKPLIAWTIETALCCPILDRVIVSTEDAEIAGISREFGAELPFIRPASLAQDDTPDLPVFQHTIAWLDSHEKYQPDIVVWLRPTTPLRTVEDIEAAVQILQETNADCVRSVCAVEHHPYWMKKLEAGRLSSFIKSADERQYYQRQTLPPVYRLNGVVDVIWRSRVSDTREEGKLFWGWDDMGGYVMPVERSIDLDSELDFALVELLLERKTG